MLTQASTQRQETPLVSVIIPNYNHGIYVSDAIQSVLSQNYENVEVIVVDDGSTDDSRTVIAAFGDQICPIWQQNQGLSAARNKGIRAAQGKYIAVLDADDMYEPDFLSTLVPRLEANPEIGAVYCGYQFVNEHNQPLSQIEARSVAAEAFFSTLIGGNFLVPEAILVRRQCYDAVGLFDEELSACADWDMWLRIGNIFNVVSSKRVLTRHRVLSGSMSSSPRRMLDDRFAVLAKHFGQEPLPNSNATDDELKRHAYSRVYLKAVVEYLQVGDQNQAYRYLQKMAETSPDLLVKLETLYEFGCGSQPKGERGNFLSLDINQNAQILTAMLDKLFKQKVLSAHLIAQRRQIYAQTYTVFGLLSYGAGQFGEARKYLLRAIAANPMHSLDHRLLSTLLKSFLGGRIVHFLKRSALRSA